MFHSILHEACDCFIQHRISKLRKGNPEGFVLLKVLQSRLKIFNFSFYHPSISMSEAHLHLRMI